MSIVSKQIISTNLGDKEEIEIAVLTFQVHRRYFASKSLKIENGVVVIIQSFSLV